MNYITLDFSEIKSMWYLHEYFKEVFDLPDYYGKNFDALWDCLLYSFEFETTIVLKNMDLLPLDMHPVIEMICHLFHLLEENDENITVQIINSSSDSSNKNYLI